MDNYGKVVLFDLDGVLIDSEEYRLETYRTVFFDLFQLKIEFNRDEFVGRSEKENIKSFCQTINKDNINDGFLSESEISELKLNGQIIYLSSCNSGLGEYVVGEGLLSISRAFLSAGAAGVISSLWPVDDKAAKEISVSYYNNYFKADSPEIAIFNAQKEYNQVHSYLKYPFVYTSY